MGVGSTPVDDIFGPGTVQSLPRKLVHATKVRQPNQQSTSSLFVGSLTSLYPLLSFCTSTQTPHLSHTQKQWERAKPGHVKLHFHRYEYSCGLSKGTSESLVQVVLNGTDAYTDTLKLIMDSMPWQDIANTYLSKEHKADTLRGNVQVNFGY